MSTRHYNIQYDLEELHRLNAEQWLKQNPIEEETPRDSILNSVMDKRKTKEHNTLNPKSVDGSAEFAMEANCSIRSNAKDKELDSLNVVLQTRDPIEPKKNLNPSLSFFSQELTPITELRGQKKLQEEILHDENKEFNEVFKQLDRFNTIKEINDSLGLSEQFKYYAVPATRKTFKRFFELKQQIQNMKHEHPDLVNIIQGLKKSESHHDELNEETMSCSDYDKECRFFYNIKELEIN